MNKKAALKTFLTLCAIVFVPMMISSIFFDFSTILKRGEEVETGLAACMFLHFVAGFLIIIASALLLGIASILIGDIYRAYCGKEIIMKHPRRPPS